MAVDSQRLTTHPLYLLRTIGDKVKSTQCIKVIRSAMLVSLAALSGAASWAARDFTPQAGTWVINQEVDGKPGRGLAIDVQGNTFFMQVFGYEKNGDATFYTATGHMDGTAVTAPLMRYQGGRSFGSEARDAKEDANLGNVTVSFTSGLKGTVQFPGEPAVEIRRFLVDSAMEGVTNPVMQNGTRLMTMLVLNAQREVAFQWMAELSRSRDNRTELTMHQHGYNPRGYGGTIFQKLVCEPDGLRSRFTCLPSGSEPVLGFDGKPAEGPNIARLNFELAGYDLSGFVDLAGAGESQPVTTLQLTGFDQFSSIKGSTRVVDGKLITPYTQQNYYPDGNEFGPGACSLQCSARENFNTLMPINGTWVVEDELTGKPGRGLALDIQGSTAILQIFNYRPDGQPSFHMGSADYVSKGADTLATVATIPMDEYANGRSIGGVQQPAQWRSHAGDALLEFAYQKFNAQPQEEWQYWTSGLVQLPGEQPVRIRRLQLERAETWPEEFLGQWFLPALQTSFTLSKIEGNAAVSEDGLASCRPPVTGSADNQVSCIVRLGDGASWNRDSPKPLMNRGGAMIRLRDRHGNGVGLGQLDWAKD